jgi:DNA replication and repair protein RecF
LQLLALETTDFRNLEHVLLEPHPRFNVLSGENGHGKTNLLEAIYLIGTLRSFRASRTEELVRFGGRTGRVRARVRRLGVERLLEVAVSPGHKSARLDGKVARASDYFGGFNVVLFAPEDLRLPKGPPAGRRHLLDRAIFNAYPAYLAEAQTYDRVLRSRNALLREGHARAELLNVYDQQLCSAAVPLVTRRRQLIAELSPLVERSFSDLTRTGVRLELRYRGGLDVPSAEIASRLGELLTAGRGRDLARGATSSGPHTDDLELFLDGRPARLYASQGQLRVLILALKIAEIQLLAAKLGEPPVLLLDDVSSELDAQRNAQLFQFLVGVDCQAFITTTHPSHVLIDEKRKNYQVVKGVISS